MELLSCLEEPKQIFPGEVCVKRTPVQHENHNQVLMISEPKKNSGFAARLGGWNLTFPPTCNGGWLEVYSFHRRSETHVLFLRGWGWFFFFEGHLMDPASLKITIFVVGPPELQSNISGCKKKWCQVLLQQRDESICLAKALWGWGVFNSCENQIQIWSCATSFWESTFKEIWKCSSYGKFPTIQYIIV